MDRSPPGSPRVWEDRRGNVAGAIGLGLGALFSLFFSPAMANQRLKKLGQYVYPHRRLLFWGVAALLVVNALGIYLPLLIRDTIDALGKGFTLEQLTRSSLLLLALTSVMWGIRMFSRTTIFGVGRQVEFDLKQRLFQHLLSLEPAYFAVHSSGDLISRTTNDVDNVRRLVGFAILSLANTLFAYVMTLPVMWAINAKLTLASLAVYPLMLMMVQLFSGRLQDQQRAMQEGLSDLSDLIQEDMSGISLIKIYAQEENERQAFAQCNERLFRANLDLAKTRNLLFPLVESLSYVSLLVLLWLGTGAIAEKAITVGDFVALLLFVERLVFPTALLGFTITAYQRGEVSVDRIEGVLQSEPRIRDGEGAIALALDQVRGQLEARHLTFTYPGQDRPALVDLNFTIQPGEMVAVVGPIGSGKSTLANTLTRLLDIAPGQLCLDEIDVTQLRLEDLRQAIAYVPQDSFLFSDQVRHNIAYGDPACGQPVVEQSAKDAQIHSEILNFPQQYTTLVGERGITLSGGQRQRTALARALLVDAPILILDDALSSVDNQTATAILHNLHHGSQRKTVLFISHQMSAAATADRILVMDQGQIVQSGDHETLLQQGGLYQKLWQQHQLAKALQN